MPVLTSLIVKLAAGLLAGSGGLAPTAGTALFRWPVHPQAAVLHAAPARRAILTRLFDAPPSLRFGLSPDESGWRRLEQALANVRAELG